MRSARSCASAAAHTPPRAISQSRTAPTVATSGGSATASPDMPTASRTPAKKRKLMFMLKLSFSVLQGRERNEVHDVAARDGLARRIVDQAVGPHGRRQHARALVGEQF